MTSSGHPPQEPTFRQSVRMPPKIATSSNADRRRRLRSPAPSGISSSRRAPYGLTPNGATCGYGGSASSQPSLRRAPSGFVPNGATCGYSGSASSQGYSTRGTCWSDVCRRSMEERVAKVGAQRSVGAGCKGRRSAVCRRGLQRSPLSGM
jgi:hypothetical protein